MAQSAFIYLSSTTYVRGRGPLGRGVLGVEGDRGLRVVTFGSKIRLGTTISCVGRGGSSDSENLVSPNVVGRSRPAPSLVLAPSCSVSDEWAPDLASSGSTIELRASLADSSSGPSPLLLLCSLCVTVILE